MADGSSPVHTSQATTRGRLRNTVRAHPLPSYFVLAYAISWVAGAVPTSASAWGA